MDSHKNAPLTPKGREAMVCSVVEGGLSQADAAYQFNTRVGLAPTGKRRLARRTGHATEAKLMNRAREKLVKLAQRQGVKLRQSWSASSP